MRAVNTITLCLLLGTCSPVPSLLDQIRSAGELIVVTRNSPTTYYYGPEGAQGPEYDLVAAFARHLGVDLNIYSKDSFRDLLPEVMEGRAHIVAAGLTATLDRADQVEFGPNYQYVTQQLVYKLGTGKPRDLSSVYGSHLEVISGSTHVETLQRLRSFHPDLTWLENPNADIGQLLQQVSTGDVDYTIADSSAVQINRYFHPEIRVAFDLSEPQPLAWAFRKGWDSSLVDEADRFFAAARSAGLVDRVIERYYGHTDRFDYVGTRTFLRHIDSRLPRYEGWFRDAANDIDLDWKLLAAMGYQESHWNPRAVSPTGVRGLMMLTRNTARSLGISDRTDAEQSIRGGARYIHSVFNRIPDSVSEPDRTWMALAAYNVGFGHLQDARILARRKGLDPDRWADVREVLPLLAQSKYYKTLRYGYARGWEPVRYVDNIRSYYDVLVWLRGDGVNAPVTADSDDEDSAQPAELDAV